MMEINQESSRSIAWSQISDGDEMLDQTITSNKEEEMKSEGTIMMLNKEINKAIEIPH